MASYKKLMSDIGKGISDVAKEIASSDYGRTIYPGKQALINELNQTIASSQKISGGLLDEKVQQTVRGTLEAMDMSDIDSMVSGVHAKTYEKDIEGLADAISKQSGNAEAAIGIMKEEAKEIIDGGLNPNNLNLGLLDKVTKYPRAYFSHPDKQIRNNRIATAAAAYAGVAVGGRYLSGGTLTTDNYGRKDIAGIPFL
jgi:hypothetical protein